MAALARITPPPQSLSTQTWLTTNHLFFHSLQESAERLSRFEAGLGEALFYRTLCALAAPGADAAAVASATPGLAEGFRIMGQQLGTGHPLAAAALREHNRLVDRAMGAEDLTLAEALYCQELALHRGFEPISEHVAMLGYQLGTLQVRWGGSGGRGGGRGREARGAARAHLRAWGQGQSASN